MAALALLAAAAGFGGGVAGSFLHPGRTGPRGVAGVVGAQGPQGPPGAVATLAPTPIATAVPSPTPLRVFSGPVPIGPGAEVGSFPIAAGAIYAFAYTVQATGTCDDFYLDAANYAIVPMGTSITGTERGSAQLYLAPGNYEVTLGALGAATDTLGDHAAPACSYSLTVTPTG